MAKKSEKELARAIRSNEGLALSEIAKRIGVSKGTVSGWVKDIELTPYHSERQRSRKLEVLKNAQMIGSRKIKEMAMSRRKVWQAEGRKMALRPTREMIVLCMLYWGEGDKTSRNSLIISNTDPNLLRLFVDCLRSVFVINDDMIWFKVGICYADNGLTKENISRWWLERLGLKNSSLTGVNMKDSGRGSKNKKPFGVGVVSVHNTEIKQKVLGGIQELGRFSCQEWLE